MVNSKWPRSAKTRRRPRRDEQLHLYGLPNALERIRQAANRDKEMRFTSLWHHVYNIEGLRKAYYSLKRDAAPGVEVEWAETELPGAATMVYHDEETGLTVIWLVEGEEADEANAGS